ncbi:hypothetical protein G3N95_26325 [Paraburkholderia sp. Tr-20389]|uniref:hypothetical protein n=1 Tax=Paraburkholderia sp. Tr-20389 TaxID=2703903 RepID=UPI00197CE809|nr:hypothetical protein [Paraburkholderia sp. Tr-20389]MBN3756480.1 hypothetical protein [Paraburkholderia sp. Tr-20389]
MNQWPWSTLDIESGSDERAVRRAYARALKASRADENPAEFQALRSAYEHALLLSRSAASVSEPVETVVAGSSDFQSGASEAETQRAHTQRELATVGEANEVSSCSPESLLPVTRDPIETLDPAGAAAEIWNAFVANPDNVTSRRALKNLFESAVSIALRDELEWIALLYCLRDDIPADCREDMADVLKWREESSHLIRRDALTARHALTKVFADEEYRELRRRFPVAVDLMERPRPRFAKALILLKKGVHCREMEALLFALHISHLNARNIRFDVEKIAFWQEVCARRTNLIRLSAMVPLLGAWVGFLLAQGLSGVDIVGSGGMRSTQEWAIIATSIAAIMLVYGVIVFRAPSLAARWKSICGQNVYVRYGWIALWLASSFAVYADKRGGAVTASALVLLAIATVWTTAVHGWIHPKGLAFLCAYSAIGYGFWGYYVTIEHRPWWVPVAQCVLYGVFVARVQTELREVIGRWRVVRRAVSIVWLVAAAATAVMLVGPELAETGSEWLGVSWGVCALLIPLGGTLATMRWGQLSNIVPRLFLGYLYMMWFALALFKPSFAAFVALSVAAFWIVQALSGRKYQAWA